MPNGVARPPAKLMDHSTSRAQDPPKDVQDDREVIAAIAAEDPAGIAMAYDRYAAALYGYCRWMLHDSADAAEALKDTFVIAAATVRDLSETSRLRPWLFTLVRNECRRRIRPTSTAARDDETDVVGESADATGGASDATVQFRAVGRSADATGGASDATVQFRAVGRSADATGGASDATVQFRAVGRSADATGEASDATVQFPAVGRSADATGEASDATVQFRAVGRSADATGEASDATVQFRVVIQPSDTTMPFRVVSQPAYGLAHLNADRGQAELRSLIYSVLADLKPREREVIELSFRHDLHDNDLAIVLGAPSTRAQALAARARSRLEEALSVLHIALTGRAACPVLRELLADWDGQLTEEAYNLVSGHIEECRTCAHHGWGALRPAAFSRLLPLAPLPLELREQVLGSCTSTAEDAVAYRRRVVRRAESRWAAIFSQAIRWVSWDSIRAYPGAAVATTAVALWVVAAVSVTLLTFAGSAAHAQAAQPTGSHATHAQAAETNAAISPKSPAAVPATATASTSASARPSPTTSQPPAYVSPSVQLSLSPSPHASGSRSTSPSPKPSKSPSPSPSHSPSPSPSPSHSTSPSSSPSPTA